MSICFLTTGQPLASGMDESFAWPPVHMPCELLHGDLGLSNFHHLRASKQLPKAIRTMAMQRTITRPLETRCGDPSASSEMRGSTVRFNWPTASSSVF